MESDSNLYCKYFNEVKCNIKSQIFSVEEKVFTNFKNQIEKYKDSVSRQRKVLILSRKVCINCSLQVNEVENM